jgi:hypothetical protein
MLALLAAALLPWAGIKPVLPAMHPMHTAVAEISYDPTGRAAAVLIRVFADDFAAALITSEGVASDSAMSRYVRGRFALVDRSGRPLPFRWMGAERAGDVVVLRLQVPAPAGLAHAKVLSTLLSERFGDQVNIVRVSYDGRATTLLFTPGDLAKTLP